MPEYLHFPLDPRFATVNQAAEWLTEAKNKGCKCPVCGQVAKTYRRVLGDGHVVALFKLYHYHRRFQGSHPSQWHFVHINDLPSFEHTGDLAKCGYPGWGMVVSKVNDDTKKRCSGSWKLTDRGFAFLIGRETVPQALYVYDNAVIGVDQECVDVRQAISKKFDYEQLMRDTYDSGNGK